MSLVTPDIGLIIWQVIVFIIVLLILRVFVWIPILSALKTREFQIEDSLRAAEDAKEEMEQIKMDNEYLLYEAKIERDQLLKEARDEAKRIIDRAKSETSEVTKKMIDDAQSSIEGERRAAVKEIREMITNLSLEIAEKVLREKLSDNKAQKELVDRYIKEIEIN